MYGKLDVFDEYRCLCGESPLWDQRKSLLYHIDITGKTLHRTDWCSGKHTVTPLPQKTGCIALTEQGNLLAGMEDGVYYLRNGQMCPAHPLIPIAGPRFNDGKIGPDGRLYVGTIRREGGGEFYRLERGAQLQGLFGGVRISNGLDWSPDNRTFYYCDTPLRRIDSFEFDLSEGTLSSRRTAIEIPAGMGSPDGLTVDAQGNLWIALCGGGVVVKADPRTGNITDKIEMPVSKPTCCIFAGTNLDTLIITTQSLDTDPREQPLAGCTFRLKTEVCGKPAFRFPEAAVCAT